MNPIEASPAKIDIKIAIKKNIKIKLVKVFNLYKIFLTLTIYNLILFKQFTFFKNYEFRNYIFNFN